MQTVAIFMIFAELLGPSVGEVPKEHAALAKVRAPVEVNTEKAQSPQVFDEARLTPVIVAQKTPLDEAVDAMQAAYEKTTDFNATFRQKYTYTLLRRTQESAGTVSFKKPGKMRWDYKTPAEKSFIIDGKKLWVVQTADQTALVNRCFKQDGLTASVAFLWGAGDIRKEFNVTFFKGVFGEKTDIHLELNPKEKNTVFAKLILVLDPKSHRVKQSIVVDPAGNVNQFFFENLKFNQGAKDQSFVFTPPKGMHVSDIPGSCKVAE